MMTVFLQLYYKLFHFKTFLDILRFIAERATKEWEYIFQKGTIYDDEDTERGDFFVKEIVGNLTEERGDEHDPYVIDDGNYRFFRIPFVAEAVHLGTYINGLKSLHKADICAVSRKAGNLSINASLGAGPLDLSILILVKSVCIERLLTVKLSLNFCKVNSNFSINSRTGRNGSLQSVRIEELSGVSFSITGFGFWLYIPSLTVTFLMKFLKGVVRNIAEFKLEQHVREVLPSYQFPIEGTIVGDISFSDYTVLDDSSEIDMESFNDNREYSKEHSAFVSENLPKPSTELRKPIWCTNLPLFEDIEEPEICNDESDISIQFQFSKDKVVQEDIEPLTRPKRPTCCVFFRTEAVQFCNKSLELLKSNHTEVAGYEDLNLIKMHQNSPHSELQSEEFSPIKHTQDFLKLLTKDKSEVSGGLNLSGSEGMTIPCNPKTTNEDIDTLINKFRVAYPKFVAFIRHNEGIDELSSLNEQCAIDADINKPTNSSKQLVAASNDEKDSDNIEVGSKFEINQSGICEPIKNAGEFSKEKYLELGEMKTAYEKKTLDCSYLHKDTLNLGSSSPPYKTSHYKEDSELNKAYNFKQLFEEFDSVMKNEDLIKKSECLLDRTGAKNPVGYSSIDAIKPLKDFNDMKHESFLKWDDLEMEQMCALKWESTDVLGKTSSQNSVSSLFNDYFEKSRFSTSEVKIGECCNTAKADTRLKTPPGIREENNNTIESSEKYDTRSAIERLDAIGDAVFRCFDIEYDCYTNLLVSTYYPDSLLTDFPQFDPMDFGSSIFEKIPSLEDYSSLNTRQDKSKDSVSERFLFEGINENLSEIKENFGPMRRTWEKEISDSRTNALKFWYKDSQIKTSKKTRSGSSGECFNEKFRFSSSSPEPFAGHLLRPLNVGDDQIKDQEKADTPVGEELMTDTYKVDSESVPDHENIDNSFFEWISDCDSDNPSVDVSSASDEEEVDVENSILCKEFTYTKCVESETKLPDPVKDVEKMERLSSGSEKSLLNSSISNNETVNFTKDSLNDSNRATILQETRNSVVNIDIQINVDINTPNIDIDSPVRLDNELPDCSTGAIPKRAKFGLKADSGRESGTDMKETEADNMGARTSKKESSIELFGYAQTESFGRRLPKSFHEDKHSYFLPNYDLGKAQEIKFETVKEKCKGSSLPPNELRDESSLEDWRNITKIEFCPVEHHLSTMEKRLYKFRSNELYEEFLNVKNKTDIFDVSETETASLREASFESDLKLASGYTPFSEDSPDESFKNLLPSLTENIANSRLGLKANKDDFKEKEFVSRKTFQKYQVDNVEKTCGVVQDIDLNDSCEKSTAEMSENLSNMNPENSQKNMIVVCLDKNALQEDMQTDLENLKNEPEQVDPNVKLSSEHLEKRQTLTCSEDSEESIENLVLDSVEEMGTILKLNTEEITKPVSLDKDDDE